VKASDLGGGPKGAGLAHLVHTVVGALEGQLSGGVCEAGVMEAVVQELFLDVGSYDGGLVVVVDIEGRCGGSASTHLVEAVEAAPAVTALLEHLVSEDAGDQTEEDHDDCLCQGQTDGHPQHPPVVVLAHVPQHTEALLPDEPLADEVHVDEEDSEGLGEPQPGDPRLAAGEGDDVDDGEDECDGSFSQPDVHAKPVLLLVLIDLIVAIVDSEVFRAQVPVVQHEPVPVPAQCRQAMEDIQDGQEDADPYHGF